MDVDVVFAARGPLRYRLSPRPSIFAFVWYIAPSRTTARLARPLRHLAVIGVRCVTGFCPLPGSIVPNPHWPVAAIRALSTPRRLPRLRFFALTFPGYPFLPRCRLHFDLITRDRILRFFTLLCRTVWIRGRATV